MTDKHVLRNVAAGAAAGMLGTVALRGVQGLCGQWMPETRPPIRRDPGEFLVRQGMKAAPEAAGRALAGKPEKLAAMALALGYGATFGAAYALGRPKKHCMARDGAALGLITWATGYLGWLPAAGLMPPIHRQSPRQAIAPALQHVLYGWITVGLFDWLHREG